MLSAAGRGGGRGARRLVVVPERRLRQTVPGAARSSPTPTPPRAMRSSAGAAVLLLAVGVWRLLATPATPPVVGEDDPDFQRVRAILASAECAEPGSNLALLGDKRFLFSPVGRELPDVRRARPLLDRAGAAGRPPATSARSCSGASANWPTPTPRGPASTALGPDDLPDLVELGFSIQKIGETRRRAAGQLLPRGPPARAICAAAGARPARKGALLRGASPAERRRRAWPTS